MTVPPPPCKTSENYATSATTYLVCLPIFLTAVFVRCFALLVRFSSRTVLCEGFSRPLLTQCENLNLILREFCSCGVNVSFTAVFRRRHETTLPLLNKIVMF